jgi:hypothetical protein
MEFIIVIIIIMVEEGSRGGIGEAHTPTIVQTQHQL